MLVRMGGNWFDNTNWLDGDPCIDEWHGVACDGVNIRWLSLQNNNLSGQFPDSLTNLTHFNSGLALQFNADGKSDILWRNSTTGMNYLYLNERYNH